MENVFQYADELGPARIVHVHEPRIGLRAVLVIDNVAAGPAVGGIRMAPDVTTGECCRLARAMTFKNAAAGLPHGGGKVVLYGDPRMPAAGKERLIRGLANALRHEVDYIFAPDMGTDETCMAWIKDEVDRVVGLPREVGGIPLDEIGATGWGLRHVVDVALDYLDFPISGARFVVQGFGAVGRNAARYLAGEGALMVGVADSQGALYNPDGIDVARLVEIKDQGGSVADYPKGKRLDRDEVIGIACDIWIPAARPDVIHDDNVGRLNTRLVVEGANIPITHSAERALHERGVLCVPDFIANAGGVICAAMEYQKASQAMAFAAIEEKVRANARQVLERSRREGVLPRQGAEELARQRVEAAMAWRRWNIF